MLISSVSISVSVGIDIFPESAEYYRNTTGKLKG
jgi:hypothetical protein